MKYFNSVDVEEQNRAPFALQLGGYRLSRTVKYIFRKLLGEKTKLPLKS